MTTHDSTPLIVAIDGPSGAGKSTIARMLAESLGVRYLDTGAMYRAVALLALRAGLSVPLGADEAARAAELARTHRIEVHGDASGTIVGLDGEDVSVAIRTPECSVMSSAVSAVSAVRRALVPLQRAYGAAGGCVVEGRDMGSVVFPNATLKVYLTATAEERARRRHRDLVARGVEVTLEEVLRQQEARDRQDTSRADSPLTVAEDALIVDTTELSPCQVVDRLVACLRGGKHCREALGQGQQEGTG